MTAPDERSFEMEIANAVGIIQGNLEIILDRNPELPSIVRASISRVIGKCMPLSNVEHLKRVHAAYKEAP